MPQRFDLVVIGTGTAASGVARRCRAAGWSVAVVDERPLGGTCAQRGCDPKKILRRGAELVDAVGRFDGKGIEPDGLVVDWPALMAFKRSFTDPVPAARERAFAEKGIAVFKGRAHFLAPTVLGVGDESLEARHVVIASGAKPAPLPIEGAAHVITSDDFLELDRLPQRILFLGGGYVSFELAHIAGRSGAAVVMIDRGERPLKSFDADLVAKLVERTRAASITFHPNGAVEKIEKLDQDFRVHATVRGEATTFATDLIVHGAGRVAAVEALSLDKANLGGGPEGIEVNEFLQSPTNPAVYAAGDASASGGLPLTPVASIEAEVVAANLLEGNHVRPDYTGVPSVVFTLPELARVGMTEAEAESAGLDVESTFTDMSDWYSVRRVGETCAAAKVLTEKGTDRIVGAHLLGPAASELINFFGLAMRTKLSAEVFRSFVSAYPSAASDLSSMV